MIAAKERQRQPADGRPVSRSDQNGQGTNALPSTQMKGRSSVFSLSNPRAVSNPREWLDEEHARLSFSSVSM